MDNGASDGGVLHGGQANGGYVFLKCIIRMRKYKMGF